MQMIERGRILKMKSNLANLHKNLKEFNIWTEEAKKENQYCRYFSLLEELQQKSNEIIEGLWGSK